MSMVLFVGPPSQEKLLQQKLDGYVCIVLELHWEESATNRDIQPSFLTYSFICVIRTFRQTKRAIIIYQRFDECF